LALYKSFPYLLTFTYLLTYLSLLKAEANAIITEKVARTAMSGIAAVQHADDGYSRRGNFGG